MAKKKLDIEVFSAWNTYAISMMSVLEHCGMWNKEYTFQRFLSVTGIASQFCVDENCSALPITDYDWMEEHACFTERIGVRTKKYYAAPGSEEYSVKQKEAITAIKKSIEDGKACVVWGIDTGEFGVIYGYDDEDKVFFSKGIGSRNANASMPVLYNNLGKTFEWAPVLSILVVYPFSLYRVCVNFSTYGCYTCSLKPFSSCWNSKIITLFSNMDPSRYEPHIYF